MGHGVAFPQLRAPLVEDEGAVRFGGNFVPRDIKLRELREVTTRVRSCTDQLARTSNLDHVGSELGRR
eukprot:691135-Alexandrium_andersonii.AAC.1